MFLIYHSGFESTRQRKASSPVHPRPRSLTFSILLPPVRSDSSYGAVSRNFVVWFFSIAVRIAYSFSNSAT